MFYVWVFYDSLHFFKWNYKIILKTIYIFSFGIFRQNDTEIGVDVSTSSSSIEVLVESFSNTP